MPTDYTARVLPYLRARIAAGRPLPSTRAIESRFGCHRNTALRIYQLLVHEGAVESKVGGGYHPLSDSLDPVSQAISDLQSAGLSLEEIQSQFTRAINRRGIQQICIADDVNSAALIKYELGFDLPWGESGFSVASDHLLAADLRLPIHENWGIAPTCPIGIISDSPLFMQQVAGWAAPSAEAVYCGNSSKGSRRVLQLAKIVIADQLIGEKVAARLRGLARELGSVSIPSLKILPYLASHARNLVDTAFATWLKP